MNPGPIDVAQVRLDNAMRLFEEFVSATVKHADAATLRGLERRFAERLDIQPSYWSQIKARSRQIGERLARQFEQRCHKPVGWMDLVHGEGATVDLAASAHPPHGTASSVDTFAARAETSPQDDDERFIVGLVLTYYRRHPQRAKTRLLDLLGEVLEPVVPTKQAAAVPRPGRPGAGSDDLWARTRVGVAPLKPKR